MEQLKIDHTSKPRNPSIIDIFYKSNMIEKWGRGTQNMVEYCLAENVPEPEYFQQADSMVVRFWFAEEKASVVGHELTSQQLKIVQYLETHGEITNKITQELLETSEEMARRLLSSLLKMKKIERQGAGRSTFYSLKK